MFCYLAAFQMLNDKCYSRINSSCLDSRQCLTYIARFVLRGHSSAGRALAWHARGRRFDPAWLHQATGGCLFALTVFASPHRLDGLGHRVFIPATGVRIPLGTPFYTISYICFFELFGNYTVNLKCQSSKKQSTAQDAFHAVSSWR